MRFCDDCKSALVIAREYFAGNVYSCERCDIKYFFPVVWYFSEGEKQRRCDKPVMVCTEL